MNQAQIEYQRKIIREEMKEEEKEKAIRLAQVSTLWRKEKKE